jgi:ankyrin repeat protein
MIVDDEMRKNALFVAAALGDVEVIGKVIKDGFDINTPDEHGTTALMIAAARGQEEAVSALVEGGADVQRRDACGCTALFHASGHPSEPSMRTSGCCGSGAGTTSFQGIAGILLRAGCDPNARDTYGSVPLHWAADNGRMGVCLALIDWDADPDAADNGGMTALMHAAKSRSTQDVDFLVRECHPDIDARDNLGMTAAMIAGMSGNEGTMDYLLGRTGGFDLVDDDGLTAEDHFERFQDWTAEGGPQ